MLWKWKLAGIPSKGSVLKVSRFELLDCVVARAPREGLWLEFGVWRGESLNCIARTGNHKVYGFDSFQGMPERWEPWVGVGFFSTHGKQPPVDARAELVPGWFDQTLPKFLASRPNEVVSFLHIDCDLYSSARSVLQLLGRSMRSGTILVFDEFCSWWVPDDEARAWREFCRADAVEFRCLGCSLDGSVALEITATDAGQSSLTLSERTIV